MTNKEKLTQNFHNNLDYYLKTKKVKIGELEKVLNVSKGYISRIKNNKMKMSLGLAIDIAEYFDTTLSHMLESEDWIDLEIKELEDLLAKLKKKKETIE